MIYPHHIYSTCCNGQPMCARGARLWFKQHGLSWSDFVAHGIAEEKLIQTGDELGLLVVQTATKEKANHGR